MDIPKELQEIYIYNARCRGALENTVENMEWLEQYITRRLEDHRQQEKECTESEHEYMQAMADWHRGFADGLEMTLKWIRLYAPKLPKDVNDEE